MENSISPLNKYKRQPKLYIDLPSKGDFYAKNALPSSDELEVFSMTASDEITIKTPDALLTGNATVKIIQNCLPGIKDAWHVTTRDLDYILTAIRIATYGDSLSITHRCSKCNNEDSFTLPLQPLLDHLANAQPKYELNVNNFTIRMRPLTYKEVVESQHVTLKVRRQLTQVVPTMDDIEERTEFINGLYEQINEHTKNVVCSVVTEIVTPDGESETTPVFIKDFLLNNEGDWYNAVSEAYALNTKVLSPPESEVTCSECEAVDKVKPNLDYTSFFSK